MGVKRVARRKNPAPKAKRKAPSRRLKCPAITGGGDPFAALRALDVEDVPAFCEVHAKCAAEPITKPSLWQRLWERLGRYA
jgi:hypothetical protein